MQRERGVALVAVLLLVAGLIAIAAAVVTLSTAQRRAAQRANEADLNREILDGAIRVALVEISYSKPDGPFWYPHQPRVVTVTNHRVEIVLEREAGRIDLNTAEQRYVVAALVAAGYEEADARHGAARIRDWIDADDEAMPNGGAERSEYLRAGLPHEPRNGPMETVEEVRQVLGLGRLDDDALGAFTVYSHASEPAPIEAPQRVREAIAWIASSAGEGGAVAVPSTTLPVSTQPVSYAGSVIRMRGCLESDRSAPCRTVVLRVTGNARNPFLVFAWR